MCTVMRGWKLPKALRSNHLRELWWLTVRPDDPVFLSKAVSVSFGVAMIQFYESLPVASKHSTCDAI